MKRCLAVFLSFIMLSGCLTATAFAASDMKLKEENYPGIIIEGDYFSVYGIVTSGSKIMSVTISVTDRDDGQTEFTYTGKPGRTEYNIHDIDYLMHFSELKAGNYTYKIVASDTKANDITLLSKNFKVVSDNDLSGIKIDGYNYPQSIKEGNTFSVYGIVSSENKILSVTTGVYTPEGNEVFSYTGLPGTKTYDIHNIDYLMTFASLKEGSYSYKIIATDTKAKNVLLVSENFKVTKNQEESLLKITEYNYPEVIREGYTFSVYGKINSNYNIKRVNCTVASSNGTIRFTKTAEPNSKNYQISEMDRYMTFSRLGIGSYVYRVTAEDEMSGEKILLEKSFSVVSASASTISFTDYNYPTSFTEGETLSVCGTVYSDYRISKVQIGVYTPEGEEAFSYTGLPGKNSYNIHDIDYLLTFSSLKAGSYIYKITASDRYSTDSVLLEKSFTVVPLDAPESGLGKVSWDFIDLSYWNEIRSWDELAQNVDGVILRIGYRTIGSGRLNQDDLFLENYRNAKEKGLHIGCYFFSNALTQAEAKEEAQFVLSILKENNCRLNMPVYCDMETPDQEKLTRQECTDITRAFCEEIAANNYYPGIYCNKYFASEKLYANELSDYTFWIAQYADSCNYKGPYGMWQYSKTGSIPGIFGDVDLDYCYYDYPEYIKANGLNGYDVSEPSFEIPQSTGAVIDRTAKMISKIRAGLTENQFTDRYLKLSAGVKASYRKTVNGIVATGTTVNIKSPKTDLGTYTISVDGDIDMNGQINSSDALRVLQFIVGLNTLEQANKLSADCSGDGRINSLDALIILEKSVGLVPQSDRS